MVFVDKKTTDHAEGKETEEDITIGFHQKC